jgi:tetratricopeptide (TPR) repeat protein
MISVLAFMTLTNDAAMRFDGLGPYHRHITTHSRPAETYFNQGLEFMYGFNKDEAIRAFSEAARLDPKCAMAYWGIATANGPDINMPMVDPDHAKAATAASHTAKSLEGSASPVEKALIDATVIRFAHEDRTGLDQAYADAMRKVWKSFPRDPDVGALFAESMMDLRPWHQWKLDGTAEPGTTEVLATLRTVLKSNPNHPQALHLLIHAAEGSSHPEWAAVASNKLRFLQPGLGHMVHMPSHIDVRVGEWQKAIEANERAIATDRAYRTKRGKVNFYRFYMVHNQHMLGYSAMMIGQSKKSLQAIDAMTAQIPPDMMQAIAPFVDGYVPMSLEARIRFGKWDEVLAAPEYPEYFPIARTLRHYARGIAFAAKGQVTEAKEEQDKFEFGAAAVGNDASIGNNTSGAIFTLARHMLAGEIALSENKMDEAVAELREGVKAEDGLAYDEPPGWILPVRHPLGAALVKAGRFAEAEQVYRADLKKLPNNGWSLYGLSEALRGEGKTTAAATTHAQFASVWKGADMQIESSCMCVRK